eukprot:1155282-Pelagomonas_calceolata.AAC.9
MPAAQTWPQMCRPAWGTCACCGKPSCQQEACRLGSKRHARQQEACKLWEAKLSARGMQVGQQEACKAARGMHVVGSQVVSKRHAGWAVGQVLSARGMQAGPSSKTCRQEACRQGCRARPASKRHTSKLPEQRLSSRQANKVSRQGCIQEGPCCNQGATPSARDASEPVGQPSVGHQGAQ